MIDLNSLILFLKKLFEIDKRRLKIKQITGDTLNQSHSIVSFFIEVKDTKTKETITLVRYKNGVYEGAVSPYGYYPEDLITIDKKEYVKLLTGLILKLRK